MEYLIKKEKHSNENIYSLLKCLNSELTPRLDTLVNICEYSEKIYNKANIIIMEYGDINIGLLAYYVNKDFCFISIIGIIEKYQKRGLGKRLFQILIEDMKNLNVSKIRLEVHNKNVKANTFYTKLGFTVCETTKNSRILEFEVAHHKI